MKGKEDLFQLIQSMSPSEKRYFTIDAQKSGRKGSRYLELFHLINGMEAYDEAPLKRRFPKSLPFDKGYLYDAILRAMRDYHSSRSRAAQVKERLLDARYLFERGLYEQCEVRLSEARRLAEDIGDHLMLLEINKEYRRLVLGAKQQGFEEQLREFSAGAKTLLEAIGEEFRYLEIYESLLTRVIKQFVLRKQEGPDRFLERLYERSLAGERFPQTDLAQLRYHQSIALYNQLHGAFDEVTGNFSRVVEWWEAHPKYKEEEFYRYLEDFSNLLHAYATNGRLELLLQLLDQLENIKPNTETAARILFQKVAIYRLISYINLGITKNLDKMIAEIEEGLDKFRIPAARRSALMLNVALLFFTRDRFADCMLWCGRLIGDRKNQYRQDIRVAIYLLNLIAALEVDKLQLMEATYRSTYRFLRKQDRLRSGQFEQVVLDYARRYMTESPDEQHGLLGEFQTYLEGVHSDAETKISHGMDELFLLWVRSKRSRKTIAELM